MRVDRRMALGLGLAASCSEDAVEPQPDGRGEYVELYLDDGLEACEGTLAAYDRFLDRAFTSWTGEPPPEGFVVPVHVLHESACSHGFSCASRGGAWLTSQLGEMHELAHVMHQATDGRSAVWLSEGVATAFGDFPHAGTLASDVKPDSVFVDSAQDLDYGQAGVFTSFLMDRHGVAAFREYFRAVGAIDDPLPADFEREFAIAFGEALDVAWPVFLSQPRCTFDLKLCDGMSTPIDIPFEIDEDDISCDDPHVMGFADSNPVRNEYYDYSPYRIVTFELYEERDIVMEASNAYWVLTSCGDCTARSARYMPGDRLPMQGATWSEHPELRFPPNESVDPPRFAPGRYALLVRPIQDGGFRFFLDFY